MGQNSAPLYPQAGAVSPGAPPQSHHRRNRLRAGLPHLV